MNEDELIAVNELNDKVIDHFQRNELGEIKLDLSGATTIQLLKSFVEVTANIGNSFTALSELYSAAIIANEKKSLENSKKELEILRNFDSQVKEVLKQLDLTKKDQADTFLSFYRDCRQAMREAMEDYRANIESNRPSSLFEMIFGRKKR